MNSSIGFRTKSSAQLLKALILSSLLFMAVGFPHAVFAGNQTFPAVTHKIHSVCRF
jgi:hypothetical protein